MSHQRKYRNADERARIAAEVVVNLQRVMPDPGSSEAASQVARLLREFMDPSNEKRTFQGVIDAPEIGEGRAVEYLLPGRRVMRHCVRIVEKK